MKKAEFITAIANETNQNEKVVKKIINTFLATIQGELVKGENFGIVGFGTFKVINRAEKEGRNPRTGESLIIPAYKTVYFSSAKALKEALKE